MWILDTLPYLLILFLVTILAYKKANTFYIILVLTCFVGLNYGVGWDYFNYAKRLNDEDIATYEPISMLIAYIAIKLDNTQLFLIINSFIQMFFLVRGMKRMSMDFTMSIFIFVTFPYFFMKTFVILRFMTALAIVFYSSTFLFKEKKLSNFLIGLFIAYNFHNASVVGLFYLIPFYFRKLSISLNIILFVSSFIIGVSFSQSFIQNLINVINGGEILSESLSDKFLRYAESDSNASVKIPLIYYTFNLINLFFKDKIYVKSDDVHTYITTFNIGCCLFLLFSNIDDSMSSRFSALFVIYFTILSTYLIKKSFLIPSIYLLGFLLFIYLLSMEGFHPDFIGRRNCFLPYDLIFFH